MINEVSTSGTSALIADRAVLHFRAVFRGTDAKAKLANRKKAHRWWKGKEAYLEALTTPENKALYVVSRHIPGTSMKRIALKTLAGRGRKRNAWVDYLHGVLLAEFERLGSCGVQLSRELLLEIAHYTLPDSEAPFTSTDLDDHTHQPIITHVTLKWIDAFMDRCNIVIRKQSGAMLIQHTSRSALRIIWAV